MARNWEQVRERLVRFRYSCPRSIVEDTRYTFISTIESITNPREVESVRLDGDTAEISKHAGLDVTGHVTGLDVHGSGVDTYPGINPLVHGLVGSDIVGYLQP